MPLLLRSVRAALPDGLSPAPLDILCADDGSIAAIAPDLSAHPLAAAAKTLSFPPSAVVLPGGVDPHVHALLPLPSTSAKTDYPECSQAALLGGTTTFLDFAGSGNEPTVDASYALWESHSHGKTHCDFAWHATVTRFDPDTRRQLEARLSRGLRSIKIYLAYKPALAISDEDLLAVLQFAAANGLVVVAHCEHPDLVPFLQNRLFDSGRTGPDAHEPSRPPYIEAQGVCRFLTFAAAARAKAYIAHVSSAEALAMADRFRDKLDFLKLETMPHYLLLDSSYTARPGFEGAKWVLSPPLRTPADSEALWTALADGRIDTLATDHCPFDFQGQKTLGIGDFRRIPNGISGIQERMPLLLRHALPRLPLPRLLQLACSNPADIFGLPRKGRIAVGADADLAVWDLDSTQTLTAAAQHVSTDYNPYEGFSAVAPPLLVTLRSRPVVRDGRLLDAPPAGHLL
jgi:dihydropyrimidinase